jgi:UDP-glucose 4-epimerase
VYIADVVDSLLAMVRGGLDGVWNVGTGHSISVLELLRVLEGQMGPAVEVRHGPPRPGDVDNSRLSIASIERDLGWWPKYGVAEGIADMLQAEDGGP